MTLAVPFAILAVTPASAATITTYYGDDDGFGVGATAGTMNPLVDNAEPGEAQFTDVRLIGTPPFSIPGFQPTGGFDPFSVSGAITSVLLTLRTGSFDSGPNPVSGPNMLVLDGMTLPSAFLAGFSSAATPDIIETRSIALDPSFYSIFSDGMVSLAGTRISEDGGSSSFQVDFLRLDITTTGAVPEPSTWAMMLAGFGMIGFGMRRSRKRLRTAAA